LINSSGTVPNAASWLPATAHHEQFNIDGTIATCTGVSVQPINNVGANTLTNYYGEYVYLRSYGSGTITNSYGIMIDSGTNNYNSGGTVAVTNAYGLYVNNPAYGTTKYAAYFGGLVDCGSNRIQNVANPVNQQDVVTKNYIQTPPTVTVVQVMSSNNMASGTNFTPANGWGASANLGLYTNTPTVVIQHYSSPANGSYIQYNFGTQSCGLYSITHSPEFNTDRTIVKVTEVNSSLTILSGVDCYAGVRYTQTRTDYFYYNPNGNNTGTGTMILRWTNNGRNASSLNWYLVLDNNIQLTKYYT
jgi:hypothetical protein